VRDTANSNAPALPTGTAVITPIEDRTSATQAKANRSRAAAREVAVRVIAAFQHVGVVAG
jgi:hypothetical protein